MWSTTPFSLLNAHSGLIALFLLSILVIVVRRSRHISLGYLPGPPSTSFILGNMRELSDVTVGELALEWTSRYGPVFKHKGTFGEDRLMISDPKALQYIFNTAAYSFQKPEDARASLREMNGPGILWAEGDVHKGQRRVMLPAFGGPESRALFPVFKTIVERLISCWRDIVNNHTGQGRGWAEIDVRAWLSRATLDAIGEAAFDYNLDTLSGTDTDLASAYRALSGEPLSTFRLLYEGIMYHMPGFIVTWIFKKMPMEQFKLLRQARRSSNSVAKHLIQTKISELQDGKSRHDVMSLLVRANSSHAVKGRLTDEELYAEMSIILQAGHETTSNSLTWILYELARNPVIQDRLRKEITEALDVVRSRGDQDLTLHDLEQMPYFQAVLKEGLRLHPAVPSTVRVAAEDTVIPLSKPILITSGAMIQELPVAKGTFITPCYGCYNRDKELWGADADQFNPNRWLDKEGMSRKASSLGVVGNLMTFSSGQRSCIGWRFAMSEMHCFLAELVKNFEFSIDPAMRIVKRGTGVVAPKVVGEEGMGLRLPLRISVLDS
ncbi:cytochrome P450 [Neolentinus lepideus HHB14362 ss-1]|uniref:Cytochrome P450 n=1 Tax=Neolentinus lepideus HHB14362 ss-1 TaxID=1314782 RepID=A0A165TU14_9AGAM|nr:cytochrome P450 [Neolentinus lepideus HHB14362 ss-1]